VTHDEINEKITDIRNKGFVEMFGGGCNYTTDWRLAGELIEEIGHKSSVINVQADHTGYAVYVRKYPTDTAKLIMYHADTPQMAIALAWLEWSEG